MHITQMILPLLLVPLLVPVIEGHVYACDKLKHMVSLRILISIKLYSALQITNSITIANLPYLCVVPKEEVFFSTCFLTCSPLHINSCSRNHLAFSTLKHLFSSRIGVCSKKCKLEVEILLRGTTPTYKLLWQYTSVSQPLRNGVTIVWNAETTLLGASPPTPRSTSTAALIPSPLS